jgi:hypothetical protein
VYYFSFLRKTGSAIYILKTCNNNNHNENLMNYVWEFSKIYERSGAIKFNFSSKKNAYYYKSFFPLFHWPTNNKFVLIFIFFGGFVSIFTFTFMESKWPIDHYKSSQLNNNPFVYAYIHRAQFNCNQCRRFGDFFWNFVIITKSFWAENGQTLRTHEPNHRTDIK